MIIFVECSFKSLQDFFCSLYFSRSLLNKVPRVSKCLECLVAQVLKDLNALCAQVSEFHKCPSALSALRVPKYPLSAWVPSKCPLMLKCPPCDLNVWMHRVSLNALCTLQCQIRCDWNKMLIIKRCFIDVNKDKKW